MEILVTIGYILICLFLFSLAIAVHEAGHLIAALALGFRVERFSIGFGPALCKRTFRGVEYRLSAIPFGGYVMIPDLDPEGTKALEGGGAEKARSMPPWKEIVVAFAGPAMNVVLAFVLAIVLSVVPWAKFGELAPVIGYVEPGGPAAAAGILPGDEILSVNGRKTASWSDMRVEIQLSGGNEISLAVRRGSDILEKRLKALKDPLTGAWLMLAGSVASETASRPVWMSDRSVAGQMKSDVVRIFRILKGLVTPKEMSETGKALGGPVFIAETIYRQVRGDLWDGIGFLRHLNVNLAVLNLLPIPVLDGGLILFSLFALVFRRRPPKKAVDMLTKFFMYALLALMAFLVWRDSARTWRMHTGGRNGDGGSTPLLKTAEGESPAGAGRGGAADGK